MNASLYKTLRGFTTIELVIVLVLLGILSAYASSRFFETDIFTEKFAHDELSAVLKHVQQRALASRCDLQVSVAPSSYTVALRDNCTSGAFTRTVPDPAEPGAVLGNGAIDPAITLSSSVSPIVFDAQGQVRNSAGSVVDVNVAVNARAIRIIGATGLVYDPAE